MMIIRLVDITAEEAVERLLGLYNEIKDRGVKIAKGPLPGPGIKWKALVIDILGGIPDYLLNPEIDHPLTGDELAARYKAEDDEYDRKQDEMKAKIAAWNARL